MPFISNTLFQLDVISSKCGSWVDSSKASFRLSMSFSHESSHSNFLKKKWFRNLYIFSFQKKKGQIFEFDNLLICSRIRRNYFFNLRLDLSLVPRRVRLWLKVLNLTQRSHRFPSACSYCTGNWVSGLAETKQSQRAVHSNVDLTSALLSTFCPAICDTS